MLRTSGLQSWATPQWLFDLLDKEFGPFQLDAAADETNRRCWEYWNEHLNGLEQPWRDRTFCNPPWSKPGPWLEKARTEAARGHRSVLLLPANGRTARWYRDHKGLCGTILLHPRIAYDGPGSQPNGGSMVLTFGYLALTGALLDWDVSPFIRAA